MDQERGDFLYNKPPATADFSAYEKIVGKGKMSTLFEARDLIDQLKEKEKNTVNTFDTSTWTQDASELTVNLPLPSTFTGSKKELAVSITHAAVTVNCNGSRCLAVKLSHPIDPDESTWVLDGRTMTLTLTKTRSGVQWPALGTPP